MSRRAIQEAIPEESRLEAFAARFARNLRPPLVVFLEGPLGAGKTTFVRALAKAMGYAGRVKSPTYGLLERYDFEALSLLHLDLYRIENEEELDYLALRDLFGEHSVLLIEWPGRGGGTVPPPDVELRFSEDVSNRSLTVTAHTPRGDALLSGLSG